MLHRGLEGHQPLLLISSHEVNNLFLSNSPYFRPREIRPSNCCPKPWAKINIFSPYINYLRYLLQCGITSRHVLQEDTATCSWAGEQIESSPFHWVTAPVLSSLWADQSLEQEAIFTGRNRRTEKESIPVLTWTALALLTAFLGLRVRSKQQSRGCVFAWSENRSFCCSALTLQSRPPQSDICGVMWNERTDGAGLSWMHWWQRLKATTPQTPCMSQPVNSL